MGRKVYLRYYSRTTGGEPLDDGPYCDYSDTVIDWELIGCYSERPRLWEVVEEEVCEYDAILHSNTVYVVYVRYTYGDTFSRVVGNAKIVGVFASKYYADFIAQKIRTDKTGKFNLWQDYFGGLDEVCVQKMEIE